MRYFFILLIGLLITSCAPHKDSGKKTIHFWTLQLSPLFDDYLHTLISQYEEQHPDVHIQWTDVPYDVVVQKLLASITAGKCPDVVNLSSDFLAKFAGYDQLFPIDSLLPQDSLLTTFHHTALMDCRYNGHFSAVPWYLNTYCVISNKAMMASAGFDSSYTPRTFSEALHFIREYKNRTGNFASYWNLGKDSFLPMMMEAEGLPIIDSTLKEPLFERAEAIKYIQQWFDLYQQGYMPRGSLVNTGTALIESYQSGQVAFLFTGPVFIRRVKENAPAVYHLTSVAPPIVGQSGAHELATMTLAVMRQSELRKESVDFAMYITNNDNQLKFCKLATIFPSTTASLSNEYFHSNDGTLESNARALGAKYLSSARRLNRYLRHPRADELREAFEESIQSACLGRDSLPEALHKAAEKWRLILRKN